MMVSVGTVNGNGAHNSNYLPETVWRLPSLQRCSKVRLKFIAFDHVLGGSGRLAVEGTYKKVGDYLQAWRSSVVFMSVSVVELSRNCCSSPTQTCPIQLQFPLRKME